MKRSAIAIVETQIHAEHVGRSLHASLHSEQVSVIFPGPDDASAFAQEPRTKAPEGAVAGVSAGGVVGGTVGLLVSIGAIAIPGVGPFIAVGPLMVALSGAAAGAALGGLAGALVGRALPEVEGEVSEEVIRAQHVRFTTRAALPRDMRKPH